MARNGPPEVRSVMSVRHVVQRLYLPERAATPEMGFTCGDGFGNRPDFSRGADAQSGSAINTDALTLNVALTLFASHRYTTGNRTKVQVLRFSIITKPPNAKGDDQCLRAADWLRKTTFFPV